MFALNHRYLFEAQVCRIVGIKGLNLAQYYNIGSMGEVGIGPGCNTLNIGVDVVPGSEIDTLLGLAYTWHEVTFDLGYNIFASEAETVRLRGDSWVDNTYAFSSINSDTDRLYPGFTEHDFSSGTAYIHRCDLDLSPAQAPSYILHALYGSVGYTTSNWKNPMQFKLGSTYLWSNRRSPGSWSIFTGAAISF